MRDMAQPDLNKIAEHYAGILEEIVEPLGVAVLIDGKHMCAMARGVRDTHSVMEVFDYCSAELAVDLCFIFLTEQSAGLLAYGWWVPRLAGRPQRLKRARFRPRKDLARW
jgi:hypothetical protein